MEPQNQFSEDYLLYLLQGVIKQTLKESEMQELEHWAKSSAENTKLLTNMLDAEYRDEQLKQYKLYDVEAALARVKGNPKRKRKFGLNLTTVLATAAILSVIATTVFYFNRRPQYTAPIDNNITAQNILPGGKIAVLTLSDGTKVSLANDSNKTIADKAGLLAEKTGDGQLIYKNGVTATHLTNTVTTPMGGEFKLRLPDGTNVWLNAGSSITYPVSNIGMERKVILNGEAYFEVAHDKEHPFIVLSKDQVVKVLGTHFNINSYANEEKITTTLVEGSVQVISGLRQRIIRPGQQAMLDHAGIIAVQTADVETALAWKNGRIKFRDADIESILRQAERWYNIKVVYEGQLPKRTFNGGISRQSNLSSLLKLLELSGIKFSIEDNNDSKTLIVKQ